MVKSVQKENKEYFMCEACNMFFETEDIAKKCEEFCQTAFPEMGSPHPVLMRYRK